MWLKVVCITLIFIAISQACSDKDTSRCQKLGKSQCSSRWMTKRCRKFCGLCTDKQQVCKDIYSNCSTRIQSCSKKRIKKNCAKTCNVCPSKTTRAPRTTSARRTTSAPRTTFNPHTTRQPVITTVQPPAVSTLPPANVCGRPQVVQSRVIGGKDAVPHSWPWQIALYRNSVFSCGGSIINSKWIVTAAHCVPNGQASDFTVTVGDHDRDVYEGEKSYKVIQIKSHENYGRLNNDIALIQLEKPIMFGKHVQPICLPEQDDEPAIGSKCYLTGWGKIKHPGSAHNILQQLSMTVQSKSKCDRINSKYTRITDQMLCAANTGVRQNQSGCHGDSGGPFVCENANGSWTLHGAVSWGSPQCNIKDAYTVFARIGQFRNWIDRNIQ